MRTIVIVVVLLLCACAYAEFDKVAFKKALVAAIKEKLLSKNKSNSDSELSLLPCSDVCKKSDDSKSCLTKCAAKQRELLSNWHKRFTPKQTSLAQANRFLGDAALKFAPCGVYCGNHSNKKSCAEDCRKRQARIYESWIKKQRGHSKKAETLSELKMIPCSRVCKDTKEDKDVCLGKCQARQAQTTKRWLDMNKRRTKETKVKPSTLSDSELSLLPCSYVCEKRQDKEKCNEECKASHANAIKRWNEMNKRIREKNAVSSDLRFVPCSRVCKDKEDKEACKADCKKKHEAAAKWWNNRNKPKTRKPAAKASPLSDLSLVPCSRVCKNKEDKEKCNEECKKGHQAAIKRWNDMMKRLREKLVKKQE